MPETPLSLNSDWGLWGILGKNSASTNLAQVEGCLVYVVIFRLTRQENKIWIFIHRGSLRGLKDLCTYRLKVEGQKEDR